MLGHAKIVAVGGFLTLDRLLVQWVLYLVCLNCANRSHPTRLLLNYHSVMETIERADLLDCAFPLKASVAVVVENVHGLQRLPPFICRTSRAVF